MNSCFLSGTWNAIDSLNLTREVLASEESNPVNIMANKTFVVSIVEAKPYTMLKKSVRGLQAWCEGLFAVESACTIQTEDEAMISPSRPRNWLAMTDSRDLPLI